jgi:hypothetical protein
LRAARSLVVPGPAVLRRLDPLEAASHDRGDVVHRKPIQRRLVLDDRDPKLRLPGRRVVVDVDDARVLGEPRFHLVRDLPEHPRVVSLDPDLDGLPGGRALLGPRQGQEGEAGNLIDLPSQRPHDFLVRSIAPLVVDEVDVELHVVRGKLAAVVADHEPDTRHDGLDFILRE